MEDYSPWEIMWNSLIQQANRLAAEQTAFDLRRRMNPHHSKEDVALETKQAYDSWVIRFMAIKSTYVQNREQLMRCRGDNEERHEFFEQMEKVLTDDFERTVLSDDKRVENVDG